MVDPRIDLLVVVFTKVQQDIMRSIMRKQKRPDPLVQALEERVPYTITIADGGDLASMRAVIKHGQTLTFSPVDDLAEIQVNDIVIVRWRGGSIMMHMVGEIRDDHFLIVNSLGKENGWVAGSAILGYVTQIIEPEPRPAVPNMLALLETAYQTVTERANLSDEEGLRLCSIAQICAGMQRRSKRSSGIKCRA